jgi:hypothetical protein
VAVAVCDLLISVAGFVGAAEGYQRRSVKRTPDPTMRDCEYWSFWFFFQFVESSTVCPPM